MDSGVRVILQDESNRIQVWVSYAITSVIISLGVSVLKYIYILETTEKAPAEEKLRNRTPRTENE